MTDRRNWEPYRITPRAAGVQPSVQGLTENLGSVDVRNLLDEHRAVLFRGFGVTETELDGVMPILLEDRLAYVHGNTPRTKVGDNVYTSTEYPPEYAISLHNELSYAHSWPSRLLFFCGRPAASGGATPLLDSAVWLSLLDDRVRERFSGGLCYRQYLHGGRGFGKSWQATFETDDPAQVEKLLGGTGASWEWTPSNALRISHIRPSTIDHPVTGEEVWFNQADQWHPASLGEETMRDLASIVPADELPQSVTFADGSPIPDEDVVAIRDQGLELAVDVAWEEGDVLLVDNLAVAHGRRPFSGSRRVLIAMS
ncbi:TauD/TfdA family dioxygenase [Streptomyces sp. NPDC001833]|uniref:TauD/TfdA family dioxygenase n=1 Tax=Streptomyces sp. NPDC001833 TaxID=3154658 RepID=UPI003329DE57